MLVDHSKANREDFSPCWLNDRTQMLQYRWVAGTAAACLCIHQNACLFFFSAFHFFSASHFFPFFILLALSVYYFIIYIMNYFSVTTIACICNFIFQEICCFVVSNIPLFIDSNIFTFSYMILHFIYRVGRHYRTSSICDFIVPFYIYEISMLYVSNSPFP